MGETNLYLAYGSNMDEGQMGERCPEAESIGCAMLPNYQFRINRRGVATVVGAKDGVVFGRLWRLCDGDLHALDRRKGVALGLYRRTPLAVLPVDGAFVADAWVYIATDATPGSPRPGYLERILDAATEQGFPPDYLEELASWFTRSADEA